MASMVSVSNYMKSSKIQADDFIEFQNFILSILGIDLTYEKFALMNSEERKSLIRDIRINKIIE